MGYVKEQMGYEENAGEALEPLSEDERAALIRALKTKWDAVNEKYQRMCHMVKLDTVGKVKRKEGMEYELKQLESDIEKLERPGPVYVKIRRRARALLRRALVPSLRPWARTRVPFKPTRDRYQCYS